MEKQAIKELMYGGVSEMMQNRRYFYHSSVGRSYSHWTAEGKAAMLEFMSDMTQYIYEAEQKSLNDRAKELVLKELKS
jgi:predicted transcriptional regulator